MVLRSSAASSRSRHGFSVPMMGGDRSSDVASAVDVAFMVDVAIPLVEVTSVSDVVDVISVDNVVSIVDAAFIIGATSIASWWRCFCGRNEVSLPLVGPSRR